MKNTNKVRKCIGITLLTVICICSGQQSSVQLTKSKSMVNVGGILYPVEDLSDPEYKRKVEELAQRIEEYKMNDEKPRDYTLMSTSDLLVETLATMSNPTWEAALTELSKRPEEAKLAIDEILNEKFKYEGAILFLWRLPSVASRFGVDYEVEITKRVLEHPVVKQNDQTFLGDEMAGIMEGGLLDHLAVSDKDETATLDQLVAEGRITKGSELEKKWRKRLTKKESIQDRVDKQANSMQSSASRPVSPEILNKSTQNANRWHKRNIAIYAVISLVVLGLCLKIFRSNSKQRDQINQ